MHLNNCSNRSGGLTCAGVFWRMRSGYEKLDRREVTGLAANPVILPSDQSHTAAFKSFHANSIEYRGKPIGWRPVFQTQYLAGRLHFHLHPNNLMSAQHLYIVFYSVTYVTVRKVSGIVKSTIDVKRLASTSNLGLKMA